MERAPPEHPAVRQDVRVCPTCAQRFWGGDARFCPFDGDPLSAARDYNPTTDPRLGTRVGDRYELAGVLGEGGMGTVYLARHLALGKSFALKVMRPDLARDQELARRFTREARAAAAVAHPNIVQITDFGELSTGVPYFVMELLEGQPLGQILRRGGPLPAARAVLLLRQAVAGLSAAHKAGIVHRDLKPDNMHVTPDDTIKILDFGVAQMAGAGRLTRTGVVFGTPHYMSPEQASGQPVDHRADIYAIGVVMYEMFAGRVPFEADTYMGVLTKHMFMAPEPPSQIVESARHLGALEDITMKCLEKRPEARYESMDALGKELDRVACFQESGDLEIAPSVRRSRSASPRRGRGLADELEMPARDELRVALAARAADALPEAIAGVPRGPSPAIMVVVGGVALLLVLVVTVALVVRGQSATVSATGAGLAPSVPPLQAPPSLIPPAPNAAPQVALVPASVPSTEVGADPLEKPERAARPKQSGVAAGPSTKPAAAPHHKPSFGSGEIINPWAN